MIRINLQDTEHGALTPLTIQLERVAWTKAVTASTELIALADRRQ
jgi:hypothetical protein